MIDNPIDNTTLVLPLCDPPIHDNVRPRHVRAGVAGQEDTRPHDIVWFGDPAVHRVGFPFFHKMGELSALG